MYLGHGSVIVYEVMFCLDEPDHQVHQQAHGTHHEGKEQTGNEYPMTDAVLFSVLLDPDTCQ
jgi:hypothetical protein